MFNFIMALFLSVAVHSAPVFKCAVEAKDKPLPLTTLEDGYQVKNPDSKHEFKIHFKSSTAELSHRELLQNPGDYIEHQLHCQLDKNTCFGRLVTSYQGRKNSREFKSKIVRSSTFVMDEDRIIFEFQLFQNDIRLVLKEYPDLSFRCRK
jgi:hypothetical protein